MPKYELKALQRELEQGKLWPVYWLHGPELWKAREALAWIREAVFGKKFKVESQNEETLDGAEVDASTVKEAAMTLSFGFGGMGSSGARLIVVRDAHSLKEAEELSELFGPAQPKSELTTVCVFLAKELDGRKKFSKLIVEKAAVLPCDEIGESNRESWIRFLAKRRDVEFPPELIANLISLDPWSLDRVEQEIEKWIVSGLNQDILCKGAAEIGEAHDFVDSLFSRDIYGALSQVSYFASQPDLSLPLLGLLGWHLRQLILYRASKGQATSSSAKSNPYLGERLRRWSENWTLGELLAVQEELAQLDFSMKQTAQMPLALWTNLVIHTNSGFQPRQLEARTRF